MSIAILTHDDCWKGLAPTVKRAAMAVVSELRPGGLLSSSPLGGEPKVLGLLVGGKMKQACGFRSVTKKYTPHQNAEEAFWLPPKGGATEPASRLNFNKKRREKIGLTILLTTDAEIKTLNRDFRGKDKPTNVLSFPDGSEEMGAGGKPIRNLGDIALAYETIAREADEQGKKLKHHLTHLTIHGVLHLLGYDHERAADAKTMESLEIAILGSMGIANPYEAV